MNGQERRRGKLELHEDALVERIVRRFREFFQTADRGSPKGGKGRPRPNFQRGSGVTKRPQAIALAKRRAANKRAAQSRRRNRAR